jgi:TonB-linked SusC/RagA family outer membrane protein
MKFFTRYKDNYGKEITYAYIGLQGIDPTIKRRIVMRIKLVSVLVFLSIMNVCAAVRAQNISMSFKNAPLKTVIDEIKKQSGYQFWYNDSFLEKTKAVNLNLQHVTIQEALEQCFQDQPLTFEILDKTIVLKPKPVTLKDKIIDFFKRTTIRGKVIDGSGAPLPGVSIRVKGTGKITITDKNGNYLLDAEATDVLIFTYIGYKMVEIKVNDQTMINTTLQEIAGQLDETVVKGYYTTTKALNTGNVSTVKAEDIAKQPISDPLAALQGRVPGLFIQQTNGAPGRQFTVRLRGQNSIANGNDPLYIVDGVPFNSIPLNTAQIAPGGGASASPLNDINSSDIESIDVLKDADATAIYGSRGANGVILITTKKGKTGKTEVNFNIYSGAGKITNKIPLLNTEQYLSIRQQAFTNDHLTPGSADYDLNGTYDKNKYTDWEKILIGGMSKISDVQGSVSGGNELTQFRFSGGYHKEGTVFPGNLNSQKISSQISVSHLSENRKFKIDISVGYVANNNSLPTVDLTSLIFLTPNAPDLYDNNGNLNWANSSWKNPFSNILQTYTEDTNNLISNAILSYTLLPGLTIKSSFGYNREEMKESKITPYSALDPIVFSNPLTARTNTLSNVTIQSWIAEPQITYTKNIWKGKLEALAGTTFQGTHQETLTQQAKGFSTDALIENLAAASTITILENPTTVYHYNAFYGRIGYTLAEKYIINLTARRDGSSRFGPGRQFGNFGAIGAAWILSKERFITEDLSFVSFAKLRGSLGSTGNDKLGDYKYLSTYSSNSASYQGTNGLYPTSLTNPFFGWEKVNKIEAAMELGFLKNRILINTSWYQNRTSNQLVGYSLPAITGFTSVQANLPAVIQNKGLEFELTTTNIQSKEFNWSTSANISFPKNKLISYPNILASSYATTYAIGQPLNIKFLYQYTGINPLNGLFTFKDQDGDGLITSAKDRVPIFLGQKFFGGISNSFGYKNFRLDVMLTFAKQKGIYTDYYNYPGAFAGTDNQPISILTSKNIQTFNTNYSYFTQLSNFSSSDGPVVDASYIRVKNIALSFSFPDVWKQFNFFKTGRVYLQAQNILTITKYKGLDPEVSQYGNPILPPLAIITAGLQFSL